MQPGLEKGVLTDTGKSVMRAIGRGLLDKTLPEQPGLQNAALDQLLVRVDALIAALPVHAQHEVSQLLSILGSAAGRRALAGLHAPWPDASVQELQAALQDMRLSSLLMRQQAYSALHDITAGAYFSDSGTWSLLSYPGPLAI